MKLRFNLVVVCLLAVPMPLWGQDGFVETSEDIVHQLTAEEQFGAVRSLGGAREETRAITVRVKGENSRRDKKVLVQTGDPTGVARLKVEFDVNSSRLRAESYEVLDQLGVALADVRVAGRQICIKGHTDSDGAEPYNLALSYDRAEAVREYIIARHTLDAADLFVVGYGEQLPLAANDSASHKQLNRRVEVTLGCPEVQ